MAEAKQGPTRRAVTQKVASLDYLRDTGILQEVNRQFFHPLGLSLAVRRGRFMETVAVIEDYRDDPDGIIFADEAMSEEKYQAWWAEWGARSEARVTRHGWRVQPLLQQPDE